MEQNKTEHKWYFNPSCTLAVCRPAYVEQWMDVLQKAEPSIQLHTVCCKSPHGLPDGSVVVNHCSGCNRRFDAQEGLSAVTVWEVLDQMEDFPLPQYGPMTVTVHDSCAFRDRPKVHDAVRSLLRKMGITIVEAEYSREKSVCCGGSKYGTISQEEMLSMQKRRAEQMPCQLVAVTCPSCMKSMAIGGKTPVYLPDLIFGKKTDVGELNWDKYRQAVTAYQKAHCEAK